MNPLQPAGKQKRKPPRKACNNCPACLTQPCNECSNCTNQKSNRRCKQRQCPFLALPSTPASAAPARSSVPASVTGQGSAVTPSGNSAATLTADISSVLLSSLPQSAASLFDSLPSTSGSQLPAERRLSASQQVDQETGGRKRQRLQEDHLLVESTFKNFVLAKKAPRGVSGMMYQCLKCNSDFPTRIICIRHALTCGKAFTGKKRGKNTRQLTCNICPFKTTTEKKLEKHRLGSHSEVATRVRCLTCNDTFSTVKILKKHILGIHKGSKPHQCKYCDKKFAHKFNMNRHMDTHLRDRVGREMDRLTHRQVDVQQWEEGMGGGGSVDTSTGHLDGGEVDHDAGSDVDDDPDLSSARRGFSVNELADAFVEQCRQNGDTEAVLLERRKALEAKLVKHVSPFTSSPPASTQPSSTAPQVGLRKRLG